MWAGLWGRLAQNSPCESIMKILRTMNLEKKIFKKCMISALSAVMLMAVMTGCENVGGTVSDVSENGSVGVAASYKDTASLGGVAAFRTDCNGLSQCHRCKGQIYSRSFRKGGRIFQEDS